LGKNGQGQGSQKVVFHKTKKSSKGGETQTGRAKGLGKKANRVIGGKAGGTMAKDRKPRHGNKWSKTNPQKTNPPPPGVLKSFEGAQQLTQRNAKPKT